MLPIKQKYTVACISNTLARIDWGLDLAQYRVMTAILASIYKLDLDTLDNFVSIDLEQYANIHGLSKSTAYRDFKSVLDIIMSRTWHIQANSILGDWHYIRGIQYSETQDYLLEVLWESKLIEHIIPNRSLGNYTKLCTLTGNYFSNLGTATLYRRIKEQAFRYKVTYSIEYLREVLGIPSTEYLRYSHFNSRVLNPAIREINKISDITVSYKKANKGKQTIELTFGIYLKTYQDKFSK
jgi:plasmid replication initiation protein